MKMTIPARAPSGSDDDDASLSPLSDYSQDELVIGRRRSQQHQRYYTVAATAVAVSPDSENELCNSYNSAYSPPQLQAQRHPAHVAGCSSSSSSEPSDLMRMTGYESMLASQQWTQQRARLNQAGSSRSRFASLRIPTHRVLTRWGLLAVSYFVCCGGPVGTEPLASAAGPLLGLVAQIASPLLFNIPLLFVITELATAYPNDGGYAVWVLNAFGPFWGFQVGFWSWAASIVDRVVYMQFLFEKLAGPLGYDGENSFTYGVEYAIKAGAAVLLTIPTLFCTKTFVRALYIQLALVLVPTLVLTVWGFARTSSLAPLGELRPDETTIASHFDGAWDIDWTTYVSIFWYYDGFYLAAVFGGEVAKPQKTYPQGLKWGFLLTWLSYLLPMLAAVCAVSSVSSASVLHWSFFEEDAYPEIARTFGGQTLYVIVLVGLVAGVTGMYMAELFCQAYQMRGMAENDLIPSVFMKRHPKYGTPRLSIYFSTVVVLALLTLDLSDVYEAKDALSALVELFIIFAAVRLRQTQPFVYRSFKMPGGLVGMVALLLLSTLMLGYQVVNQFRVMKNALVLSGIAVVGFVYSVAHICLRNRQKQKSARAMMLMQPTMMLSSEDIHDTVFIR